MAIEAHEVRHRIGHIDLNFLFVSVVFVLDCLDCSFICFLICRNHDRPRAIGDQMRIRIPSATFYIAWAAESRLSRAFTTRACLDGAAFQFSSPEDMHLALYEAKSGTIYRSVHHYDSTRRKRRYRPDHRSDRLPNNTNADRVLYYRSARHKLQTEAESSLLEDKFTTLLKERFGGVAQAVDGGL